MTRLSYEQLPLLSLESFSLEAEEGVAGNQLNTLQSEDRAFHDWYRFVLSFPPHLVRDYINDFGLDDKSTLLDPFCGTGTTIVESKLNGIPGIGLEANPFPHFATSVKVDWSIDPDVLMAGAAEIADDTLKILRSQGIDDNSIFSGQGLKLKTLAPESNRILIKDSISPIPLHKTLILLECLRAHREQAYYQYGVLALGNALVNSIGNLRFGPEVGVGKKKKDVPVVSTWLAEIRKMAGDLRLVAGGSYPVCPVHLADSRSLSNLFEPKSIDAVITSPPYPNEKDYTRTTRLESVVLGFFENMAQLRKFKKTFVRSNTRGVYRVDTDDGWVSDHAEVQRIAEEIEGRRVELGKTSGFEKLYARVTRLYFGGMARHLSELQPVLRPGARLAYVVGDQASYLQVMIRTGQLLADIAERLGYEVDRIDLFRTRFATATQSELREEVVVLRWPGGKE
jgi:hypothetical protein